MESDVFDIPNDLGLGWKQEYTSSCQVPESELLLVGCFIGHSGGLLTLLNFEIFVDSDDNS